MARVTVVGSGVVGLTSAHRLLEAGHDVTVVSRDPLDRTTSAVAAALWFPFLAAPRDRVLAWARRTREVQARLTHRVGTGVTMSPVVELHRQDTGRPWWSAAAEPRPLRSGLPPGFAVGWQVDAPIVRMEPHLAWLQREVQRLGGIFRVRDVRTLQEARDLTDARIVVNASGLGARRLAADASLVAVRGQVVRLAPVRGDTSWLVAGEATYSIARGDVTVVGGTAQHGDEDVEVRPAETHSILARAARLDARLGGRHMVSVRAGLRPWRPEVRLEREGDVVHVYGHGGSGVTLSWGCAEDVARLVG